MGDKVMDKIEIYDILGIIVPGTLLVAWLPICFPRLVTLSSVAFPEAFTALVLVAVAIFAGHLLQAVGSLFEKLMCRSWGGKHSETVFCGDPGKCLPEDALVRIRAKLARRIGADPSDQSVYLYAAQLAETAGVSRVAKFNSLYAYHRAVLTLTFIALCLLVVSAFSGAAANWPRSQTVWILISGAVLLWLLWNRTRQRSVYFVREVLVTAERLLDDLSPSTPEFRTATSQPVAERKG